MTLKLITAPATEPITLADAKLHLRVDTSADDALITTLITAAREQAEHELGRALITQTWERVFDAFPDPAGAVGIPLGMPPIQSVTSVKYIDASAVEQTFASTAYSLDADTPYGWVLPAVDTDWPDTLDTANAVRVRFVCGFGALGTDVPDVIRSWMLLQIGALFENREAIVVGAPNAPLAGGFVDRLLDRYRTYP